MAYDTWDWTRATGAGMPTESFEPERKDPLLTQEKDYPIYVQTRPQSTKGWWVFEFGYSLILPQNYIYMLEFWHDHRGGLWFYFRWPFELAGIPDTAYAADPGGLDPWSSEIDIAAGYGPTFLACFDMDSLPVSRIKGRENYYRTKSNIIVRTV